jgi:hypothetical protein
MFGDTLNDGGTDVISTAMGLLASSRLKILLSHWNEARGHRLMPAWHDLDAIKLAPVLPIIWSWKYDIASRRFTGRLAGEDIRSVWGKPIANVPMEDYFCDSNYDHILRRHTRVVGECCVGIEGGMVFQQLEYQGYGERLMLPLSSDGVTSDGIVGATTYTRHRNDFEEGVDLLAAHREQGAKITNTSEHYLSLLRSFHLEAAE